MHARKEQVVACIAEVRHASLGDAEVLYRRRHVDRRQSHPAKAYSRLGVEIEVAHEAARLHRAAKRRERIDPEAKQRIADFAQALDPCQRVRDFPPNHPQARRRVIEHRHPQDHCFGPTGRKRHEARNRRGRMLTIGIHDKDVGESGRLGGPQTVENGSAFAAILCPSQHVQARVSPRPLGDRLAGAIGAAVNNDPYGSPLALRSCHRFQQLRAGIVAGDQNEVARGCRRAERVGPCLLFADPLGERVVRRPRRAEPILRADAVAGDAGDARAS